MSDWEALSWDIRPLTDEEVNRYRRIVAGRRGHTEKRDWSDRDIAALIATLDECEGRVVQAQDERS